MALEPQTRRVVDFIAQLGLPDLSEVAPDVARRWSTERGSGLPPGPDTEVAERSIPGPGGRLAVRMYRPLQTTERLPALLWFHGGGFVVGDLDEADANCRHLATQARAVVASVNYRLAPEHPFPAAPEDGFAALRWLAENAAELRVDSSRIAVGGESAGGNLAIVTALLSRDRCGPELAFQLLVYPVADWSRFDTASYLENAEGYFLTRRTMMWFASHYVPRAEDAKHPHASPLLAPDLGRLPPALVITAEHDPLRDEGEALARRLEGAGVPVALSRYDGTIHGFFTMHAFIELGQAALREAAHALSHM